MYFITISLFIATCCQHLSLSSNHAQFDSDAKGVYVQKSANSVTGSGKWLIYRKAYAENVYLAHKNTEGGETPWRIANDNVVQPGVEGANLEQLGFDVVCPEHLTRFLHQGSFSTVVDIECLNGKKSEILNTNINRLVQWTPLNKPTSGQLNLGLISGWAY